MHKHRLESRARFRYGLVGFRAAVLHDPGKQASGTEPSLEHFLEVRTAISCSHCFWLQLDRVLGFCAIWSGFLVCRTFSRVSDVLSEILCTFHRWCSKRLYLCGCRIESHVQFPYMVSRNWLTSGRLPSKSRQAFGRLSSCSPSKGFFRTGC